MIGDFGDWLEAQRKRSDLWKKALFAALALLTVANFFMLPLHPHFVLDAYPLFWPAFGLVIAVVLTVVLKKVLFPIIGKAEDFYERGADE